MKITTHVVYFFYLLFIIGIVTYNVLYLSRALHTSRKLGLDVPRKISRLVRTSIALAICTSVFIVVFLFIGF